jgi:NAD(P)-dependent dehydrogenase (short-subunit alcohol dehydrogenase family)
MSFLNLEGKTAIVTGAGRHIGRQIAMTLANEGARVVVNDYFAERAKSVADEIHARGREAIGIQGDVRNEDQVNMIAKEAFERFGRVDILVNNAGLLPEQLTDQSPKAFAQSDRKGWDDLIGVNLYGVLNCTRAVIRQMIAQKYGKIINVISDAGRVGEPGLSLYSAAKAGIVGFSKSLAKEIGQFSININCVSLGSTPQEGTITQVPEKILPVLLRMHPLAQGLQRLGLPSDAANAVAFFASDASSWITGQVLSVSGGYTMVG